MIPRRRLQFALLVLAGIVLLVFAYLHPHRITPPQTATSSAFADPATCAGCHADAAAGYSRNGMAHAFRHAQSADGMKATAFTQDFYHPASDTHFAILQVNGGAVQRRWQLGPDGKKLSLQELSIDEVMGSGNHAQTFLHREPDGTLIELPLGWYAENGGAVGMNPGYDNAAPSTQHTIAYECMFCHNAYPAIPPVAHRDTVASPVYVGELPQGVDCQRCHGPGQAHVLAARTSGIALDKVRSAILNPARLSADRQMQVCEQCHLETTSHRLPDRLRHYDREPFSYRADQPLSEFISYFDRDPAVVKQDQFEIVSAPYRLRQSKCFRASAGSLTCEKCHNPHDIQKGPTAAVYYANVCLSCHQKQISLEVSSGTHPASGDCVSCHMPKRRTEDVVHVVVTDHLIQRRPAPSSVLLAKLAEVLETPANSYRGNVLTYAHGPAASSLDEAFYSATAQVMHNSNMGAGIPRLRQLLQETTPKVPDFSIELGDALRRSADMDGAVSAYTQALAIDPQSSRAKRSLGIALAGAGQPERAVQVLSDALAAEPGNALLWYERSQVEARQGKLQEALADLKQALVLKPDLEPAQNNIGIAFAMLGDIPQAKAAFEAALMSNPYDSGAQANLARALATLRDLRGAAFYLKKAVQLDESNLPLHKDYASVLLLLNRQAEARTELNCVAQLEAGQKKCAGSR